jgi:hypothetical protein
LPLIAERFEQAPEFVFRQRFSQEQIGLNFGLEKGDEKGDSEQLIPIEI